MFINILKIITIQCLIPGVILWPNHDISTLRLLQVVHRHGDRTPTSFMPNDPFSNETKYWYEGIGELTLEGKYRMYKVGQYIRSQYQQYLGDNYSPREVYARSSLSHRCIESVSCLMAGAYPPTNKQWQWNNGSQSELGLYWQPFPIESFIPQQNDSLLDIDKSCPNADKEREKIFNSQEVKQILTENAEFLNNISKYVGLEVNTLLLVNRLHEDLMIEHNRGYKWSDMKIWSHEYEQYVYERLEPMAKFLWRVEWDNKLIERVRAGNLINELIINIENKIKNKNSNKLMVYSTHDTMIAVLLHALEVYNNEFIPFGATVFIEFHEKLNNSYFIKIYYFNETLPEITPYLLTLPNCDNQTECPFDMFIKLTKDLIPVDWDNDCGIKTVNIFAVNIAILIINLILVFVLIAIIIYNIILARTRFLYSQIQVY